ncbi:MAG: nitroreductase family protein [Candidatus Omnitrophota bacterium]
MEGKRMVVKVADRRRRKDARMKLAKTFMVVLGVLSFSGACSAQVKDTLTVIHSRRSVRHYTGQPVSRKDLETLVKAGMAAPTALDKRPWSFVVVTDEAVLKKLAEGLPYSKMIVQAKSAIVVCGVMTKAGGGEAREFWVQDCSAATENILLAAEAMGLGTVWTGMYPFYQRVEYVQKVLGIPREVIPLNVIAVGFPTGEDRPKDKFDPANIHWDKW